MKLNYSLPMYLVAFLLFSSMAISQNVSPKNFNNAELAYYNHTIDDDNTGESNGDSDGQVNAGEHIELPLAIINNGTSAAHYVSAVLSTSDPDIEITDNEEYFGLIEAGAIDWCNNDFDFEVAPNCPEKDVEFTLIISSDEESWTSVFSIHIYEAGLPDLSFANYLIDDDDNNDSNGDGDGIPESGEAIELPVSLINNGEAMATNVTAILNCTNPNIDITDYSESFADISVGQEVWCNYNFNFDINPMADDQIVTFILNISSDQGSWTSNFDIDIFDPGSPDLSYSNLIIDDDAAGSSLGNGNGICEAGEIVEIPIQLINNGPIMATSVTATISTNDPDVNITDAFEYYPNIAAGNSVWCDNDYDIEISSSCPEKDVLFQIVIESAQGSWTDSFMIHIAEQGLPNLAFSSFIIDDDNDNNSSGNDNALAEPGESIELPILIENTGEGDAHNVSAVLSCNDPYITIVDANENYGLIPAGSSDWSNNEFDFFVDPSCPDKDVLFTLQINADEGSWTNNFIVHIHITGSPNLGYVSHLIDDDNDGTSSGDGDGQPEPGENIEMPLLIINNGTAAANNVVAQISCADPDITITDNSENFGSILPTNESWSNLDFDFTVAYGAPEKDVEFILEIYSDEGSWSDSFTVHIFPASGYPDLEYVNHDIDDDDNGFSNGNDDGLPAAGETIEMPVLIANTGNATAHNITAILSCSDPDIDVTDNSENFPDLNSGEQAWSDYAFDFEIAEDCPDKTVTFTLEISCDEGNFTQNFTQQIIGAGSPALIFVSYTIDDDQNGESYGDGDAFPEPGESIELPVLISNIGDGIVNNVFGTLVCNDPDIIVNDNYESFGDLEPNTTALTANDFDFDIAEDCPEKDVEFDLLLEGDEGSWLVNFTIHITPHIYYNVVTYSNPTNGGTTEGGGSFMEGEECSVFAEAAWGHTFVNWTKSGEMVSENPVYTFIVNENTSLIAHFSVNEYQVNVDAYPETGGTVDGGGTYQYGETATVTAFPNADYTFIEWTVNGETVSTNTSYSFVVENNTDLLAHFQGELYIISLSASPAEGGSVSGGGEFQYGEIANLNATAATNFEFVNWTENGSVVSSDPNYSFEVTSNRDLTAHFSEDIYTITAVAVPENAAVIEGAGTFIYGQYCSLSAIPNGGFYFIDWKENGASVSTNPNYGFTVSENRNLEAHFGVFDYTISTQAFPADAGTVSGGGSFNFGDELTVSANPNTGWEFLSWTHNGQVVSVNANYTFTVTESMVLQANFVVAEYLISASTEPGNGGSVDGDGVYTYGEMATLYANPAAAYEFLYWTEDGDVVSEDPEYSFMVTANRNLSAHFQIMQFEITIQASPAYGGNTNGGGTYEYGATASLFALPNANYEFVGWTEEGILISTSQNFSFTVLENRNITAEFQLMIALNEPNELEFKLYPNPVHQVFYIESLVNGNISVLDINAKEIINERIKEGTTKVDITALENGLYFVLFTNTKGENRLIKIIKQ